MEWVRHLIIGAGETGAPLNEIISRKYVTVQHDPCKGLVANEALKCCKFMHICIPGDLPEFLMIVEGYISTFSPEFVLIHSSVPVGTTAALIDATRLPSIYHTPVIGKHATMLEDMLRHPKFVGAYSDPLTNVVEELEVLGFRAMHVGTPEVTELGKLMSTTLFGYLIAWEQELERICDHLDIEPKAVRMLWTQVDSDDYNTRTKFPGIIGGHCVMPNIGILREQIDSQLLEFLHWSNEEKKKRDSCES